MAILSIFNCLKNFVGDMYQLPNTGSFIADLLDTKFKDAGFNVCNKY